jgi:hypothetical protein
MAPKVAPKPAPKTVTIPLTEFNELKRAKRIVDNAEKPFKLRGIVDINNGCNIVLCLHDIKNKMIHNPETNKVEKNYNDLLIDGVYTYIGQNKSEEFDELLTKLANGTLKKPVLILTKCGNRVKHMYICTSFLTFVPRNPNSPPIFRA